MRGIRVERARCSISVNNVGAEVGNTAFSVLFAADRSWQDRYGCYALISIVVSKHTEVSHCNIITQFSLILYTHIYMYIFIMYILASRAFFFCSGFTCSDICTQCHGRSLTAVTYGATFTGRYTTILSGAKVRKALAIYFTEREKRDSARPDNVRNSALLQGTLCQINAPSSALPT